MGLRNCLDESQMGILALVHVASLICFQLITNLWRATVGFELPRGVLKEETLLKNQKPRAVVRSPSTEQEQMVSGSFHNRPELLLATARRR